MHFTYQRGSQVAEEAGNAAWAYWIPANSLIYFAVDYDAYNWEAPDSIIPYFQGVRDVLNTFPVGYRVGVYGPRNVCTRLADAGVTALAPAIGVGHDSLIPTTELDRFEEAWYGACVRYSDSLLQLGVMAANRNIVKSRVEEHDAFITSLASQFDVYKALIMTPLIRESMVIRPSDAAADAAADAAVRAHYAQLEATGTVDPLGLPDSSTGPCQIFAATAIAAREYAVINGLLTERIYNPDVPEDVWEVWQKLNTDEEYNIMTAMFVMMWCANIKNGVGVGDLRRLTPSQVTSTCFEHNGTTVPSMIYGRNRAQLYFAIRRWHESFR